MNRLLSTKEVATQMQRTVQNVSLLARQGKIKAIKLGEGRTSAWVFTQKDIDAYEASNKKARSRKCLTKK